MSETLEIGTAGEYAVVSEMLFRGFNASIMSVDTGIDVVAIKDNKTYLVQVKTSKRYDRDYYHYDVTMKTIERFSSGNIFYIFVLRNDTQNDFVILPSTEVEKQIREEGIKAIQAHKKYRVSLRDYEDKIYVGNKQHDLTYYLNNWDVLK